MSLLTAELITVAAAAFTVGVAFGWHAREVWGRVPVIKYRRKPTDRSDDRYGRDHRV